MQQNIQCKLTGMWGPGVKSHIIPRSFYKDLGANRLLISNKEDSFPKKSPDGWYDKTIVTFEGEKYFNPLDDYGFDFLINQERLFKEFYKDGELIGYTRDGFDYKKLKLFFLSLLWRIGASQLEPFKHVDLGPHLSVIKEMILNSDPGRWDSYPVILTRFYNLPDGEFTMNPVRSRIDGINCYRIYMAEYLVVIKVDRQKIGEVLECVSLKENGNLFVIAKDFGRSQEKKIFLDMALKNHHKFPPKFLKEAGFSDI